MEPLLNFKYEKEADIKIGVSLSFYSSYFLRRRRKITCPRITSRSMNAPRYPTNRRLFSTPSASKTENATIETDSTARPMR